MKLTFLVSGNGGNLKFFYHALRRGLIQNVEISVIADRDCGAYNFASAQYLASSVISYSKNNNEDLKKALADISPDIIVTNWYRILDAEIVSLYENKLINLHYSLLPAFQALIGTAPVIQALEMGCRYTGATCHFVDKGVDTGPILGQAIVAVDGQEFNVLMNEIFRKGCLLLLNTIQQVSRQNLIGSNTSDAATFSPPLTFDDKRFGSSFWGEVEKL